MMKNLLYVFLLIVCEVPRIVCLPAGFRDEGINFKSGTTGFAFVPKDEGGHMLLICQRKGEVIAMLDPDIPDSKTIKVLDIENKICRDGERGISQVQPHPNFKDNRFVYLFYTYDKNGNCKFSEKDGPVNVVSRFRLTKDMKMVDERIILQTTPLPAKVHNAGDMIFGNDGYLYVSIGNGGMANEYSNGQKLNTLLGSIVRITDSGGIPKDNPFTEEDDRACSDDGKTSSSRRCSEIFAYGFRNPFRMAFNSNEKDFTQLYVSDVGGATWEEISEVSSRRPGLNYGYREREGPCKRGSKTDCAPDRKYEDPFYWYDHNSEGDGAVTGGAFAPNGVWPNTFDNQFIFADFIFQKLYILKEDGDSCRTCSPPRPAYEREELHDLKSIGQPVQVTFGPYKNTQALYYSIWDPEGEYTLRRLVYEGGKDSRNRSPEAHIFIEDKVHDVGQEIVFDGSESSDPDGDKLTYRWDFGDGGQSSLKVKRRSYQSSGTYVVSLTVEDEAGFQDKKHATVIVGIPPSVTIETPRPGTTFAVGDIFTLTGFANDADGNRLSVADLTWEVRQHHNTHYHPFLEPTSGNGIVLPRAPAPEDFHASTNSYLEIILTAADKNGVRNTASVDIMPKMHQVFFRTEPPGFDLTLDGLEIETPITGSLEVTTWINHNLVIDIEDQRGYVFESLSNGVQTKHSEHLISEDTEMLVAKFSPIAPQEGCETVIDIICRTDNLEEFCAIVRRAGLVSAFRGGIWTVFAPNNQAFALLPIDLIQRDSIEFANGLVSLEDVILFHTCDEEILDKKTLPCVAGQNLMHSAMGKDSRTLCENDIPRFQKGHGNTDDESLPEIVEFDIAACNGVVHVVDKVLLFDTFSETPTSFVLSRGQKL